MVASLRACRMIVVYKEAVPSGKRREGAGIARFFRLFAHAK